VEAPSAVVQHASTCTLIYKQDRDAWRSVSSGLQDFYINW